MAALPASSQPALSEILAIFNRPIIQETFTVSEWEDAFEAHLQTARGDAPAGSIFDTGFYRQQLKLFVRQHTKTFLSAINYLYLSELVGALNQKVLHLPEVAYESFTLTKDMPTYEEIQSTIALIYGHISRATAVREECNHYTTVLKSASDYVSSFRKTLEVFLLDESVAASAFQHLSERKRFAEPLTVDLETIGTRIGNLRATVTTLHDNVLGQRITILMRSDSAVRLLVNKQDEQNGFGGKLASRRQTTAPTEASVREAGFDVTTTE